MISSTQDLYDSTTQQDRKGVAYIWFVLMFNYFGYKCAGAKILKDTDMTLRKNLLFFVFPLMHSMNEVSEEVLGHNPDMYFFNIT
jgi:hypothetical protein